MTATRQKLFALFGMMSMLICICVAFQSEDWATSKFLVSAAIITGIFLLKSHKNLKINE